jgi:hypothetical protein
VPFRVFRVNPGRKMKDGNRIYYKGNKDHPLHLDIKNIVLKTIGLSDILKNVLSLEKKNTCK